MQKTILITGGAGYVGSHIALVCAQKGYKILLLDRLIHEQKWQHPWAQLIYGDCGDTQLLRSIFENYTIHAVIHCAAFMEVSESIKQPLAYYLNNVAVTLQLLQMMHHYGIQQFIFSSSCAVYGMPQHIPISESHPKAPLSPYGQSKLMAEQILQDVSKASNIRYITLRYFNAAGALPEYGLGEMHQPETHVIPRLLQCVQMNAPFTIFGTLYATPDGTALRDYTHVIDIAYAHLNALSYLEAGNPSDTFNIGGGKGTSVKQLIASAEQVTRIKIKTIIQEARAGDAPILVADNSKASQILNWQPRFSDMTIILQSAYGFMKTTHTGQCDITNIYRNE